MGVARVVTAVFFVVAGSLHFIRPDAYVSIIPAQLPSPKVLVAVSGAAEILGGVGLLVPRIRRVAGWGLVALLVAVFPANVNMALHPDEYGGSLPPWALWARLPLQAAMVAWVLLVSKAPKDETDDAALA